PLRDARRAARAVRFAAPPPLHPARELARGLGAQTRESESLRPGSTRSNAALARGNPTSASNTTSAEHPRVPQRTARRRVPPRRPDRLLLAHQKSGAAALRARAI